MAVYTKINKNDILYINKKFNNEVVAGERLEYLKNIWVESDFKISEKKLIKYL